MEECSKIFPITATRSILSAGNTKLRLFGEEEYDVFTREATRMRTHKSVKLTGEAVTWFENAYKVAERGARGK